MCQIAGWHRGPDFGIGQDVGQFRKLTVTAGVSAIYPGLLVWVDHLRPARIQSRCVDRPVAVNHQLPSLAGFLERPARQTGMALIFAHTHEVHGAVCSEQISELARYQVCCPPD